jgi:hypothetical protein
MEGITVVCIMGVGRDTMVSTPVVIMMQVNVRLSNLLMVQVHPGSPLKLYKGL